MTKAKPVGGTGKAHQGFPCDVTLRQPRSQVLQHAIAGQLRGPGGSTGWSVGGQWDSNSQAAEKFRGDAEWGGNGVPQPWFTFCLLAKPQVGKT